MWRAHHCAACVARSCTEAPLLPAPLPTRPPTQDFVTQRLQAMPGVKLAAPQGAFYVMPEVSAFVGPGVQAAGFGPVPDVDMLCRWVGRRVAAGQLHDGWGGRHSLNRHRQSSDP